MRWSWSTALAALHAALPALVRADDAACLPSSINDTLIGGGPPHQNVLNNSCARLNQQSVLKNGSIWVSGGTQVYADFHGDPVQFDFYNMSIGQNHYLIETDMRRPWDWKCNISQTAHDMSFNARTGAVVPVVKHGAMYQGLATDSKIWLFGGTTPRENTSSVNWQSPAVDQYSLWSYDMSTDVWQQADVSFAAPRRPSRGYSAEAPDQSLAFWVGGALDGGSSQALQSLGTQNSQYLSGMLIFDFSDPAGPLAYNVSGPPWQDHRAGGLLHYVSTYGPAGVLVAFGGASKAADELSHGDGTAVNMTDIWVMDVSKFDRKTGKLADDAWYQQTATGSKIPEARVDSCVVGVAANDRSSYQVYMYGGRWGNSSFDNTFALSIPQFVWTPIYHGTTGRYGHNCHLSQDWQMVTVGGSADPRNLTACDWESRGVAVYDLSQGNALAAWGSVFRTSDSPPPYRVPQAVYRDIGGRFGGGATQTAPAGGFGSAALATVLATTPTRQPEAGASSPGLTGGAIAGIVVGAVAAAALVLAAAWLVLRRGRRGRAGADHEHAKHSPRSSTTASERVLQRATPDAELASETRVAEKVVHEKDGATQRFEAPGPAAQELAGDVRYEVDGYTTELIELPGESKYDAAKKTTRS